MNASSPAVNAGRPFTGARIETSGSWPNGSQSTSRPFTGARIETVGASRPEAGHSSPLHGGADRNFGASCKVQCTRRRPFTGARIETVDRTVERSTPSRRPFTGARIETTTRIGPTSTRGVAPSRGRGSKQHGPGGTQGDRGSPLHGGADRNWSVAWHGRLNTCRPFTGARIETRSTPIAGRPRTVAPSRGRGSKPRGWPKISGWSRRPFTGARIETSPSRLARSRSGRRPFTGARIETILCTAVLGDPIVAPSRGRGSKQSRLYPPEGGPHVAPSRGRGSKLMTTWRFCARCRVAPSRGRGSKHHPWHAAGGAG